MADVSSLDRAPKRRSGRLRTAVTVTATQLGAHLGLTRQRIGTLADTEHVIERLPDGRFDQDGCRLTYLKWLRDPARRSARSQADSAHVVAKTELLKLRLLEKRRDVPYARFSGGKQTDRVQRPDGCLRDQIYKNSLVERELFEGLPVVSLGGPDGRLPAQYENSLVDGSCWEACRSPRLPDCKRRCPRSEWHGFIRLSSW
jgi:hypothetical protein